MGGPGFKTPRNMTGIEGRGFVGGGMHLLDIRLTYKKGPVELFSNSDDDRKQGIAPGIGRNYDGYRVFWVEKGGFTVTYDYLGGSHESPRPTKPTRQGMIDQFKLDVVRAARRNQEIRKFVLDNPEIGITLR